MAEIYISKIKARRGTDQQRRSALFDQGEIVYTTDTKRLYVGNGLLSGGNSIASKVHPPLTNTASLSNLIAEVGDITSIDNVWYQLTANPYTNVNNWGAIRVNLSPELFFDNNSTINIAFSSISASKINPDSFESPLSISDSKFKFNYNTSFFELSDANFSLSENSITPREISSTSFGDGISGGDGNIISLKIRPERLFFDNSGRLDVNFNSLSSTRYTNRFFTPLSSFNSLSTVPAMVGDVVTYDTRFYQLTSEIFEVDPEEADFEDVVEILNSWVDITPKNSFESATFDTLTGFSTTNSGNSLSAIFNGTPAHTIEGGIPGLTITKFEAVSSNGVTTQTVELSSAGFLTFEGDYETKTGQLVGRFAIPIFAY